VNWFGFKLGAEGATNSAKGGDESGGVGKYLSLKRPPQTAAVVVEHFKKRKIGFGEFENF
jgi:hypothetical protein